MFKNIMNKINPTIKNLEKELLSDRFDKVSAETLLQSKKININTVNENGETFLHLCLKKKKYRAIKWLLEQGMDINKTDSSGASVLRLIAESGEVELLNSVMKNYNIDINTVDKDGRSLLQDAVINGHKNMASKLIEHNIDVNIQDKNKRNVAFDAISYGDDKVIEEIITHNDIDLNVIDKNGKTILHENKVLENDKLASKLLERGADPTICDKDGYNFLTKTALKGKAGEAILEVAIRCGCDLNKKIANEKSILMEVMYAFANIPKTEKERRFGLKNIAKQLVRHGIDINAIDNKNETALYDLIRIGDVEGCAFVLENNISINHKNDNEETALNLAILKGVKNLDIILLLLQYDANIKTKNKYNKTIPEILNDIILQTHGLKNLEDNDLLLNIESTGNYLLILKEILALKKFNLNYLNSKGDPLYFEAFLYNEIRIVQLYLKYGIDINLVNKDGHNLFYEYVLQSFKIGKYKDDFRDNLIFLLIKHINRDTVNKDGQNIYTKVATLKECNLSLFRILIDVTKHDYKSTDNLGRTIMHHCVFNGNNELLELVSGVESTLHNIDDNFNMLPITYAALGGHKEIVKFLINKNSNITSSKSIPAKVKEKFAPLLQNFTKLLDECTNKDWKQKLNILHQQLHKDLCCNLN